LKDEIKAEIAAREAGTFGSREITQLSKKVLVAESCGAKGGFRLFAEHGGLIGIIIAVGLTIPDIAEAHEAAEEENPEGGVDNWLKAVGEGAVHLIEGALFLTPEEAQ
jgi:hypothetical protein